MKLKATHELSDRASTTLENQIKIYQCLSLVDSLAIPVSENTGISTVFMRHLKIELQGVFEDMGDILKEEVPGRADI